MKKTLLILTLFIGLLAACGAPATEAPASQPTDQPAAPTQTSAPAAPESPTENVAPTSAAQTATVSFAADVLPIFQSRCENCHGGNRTEEGLDLLSFDAILQGSKNGLVVTPGDAENSLLVQVLVKQEMPKRGPKLTPTQVQLITDWVNQGALNN